MQLPSLSLFESILGLRPHARFCNLLIPLSIRTEERKETKNGNLSNENLLLTIRSYQSIILFFNTSSKHLEFSDRFPPLFSYFKSFDQNLRLVVILEMHFIEAHTQSLSEKNGILGVLGRRKLFKCDQGIGAELNCDRVVFFLLLLLAAIWDRKTRSALSLQSNGRLHLYCRILYAHRYKSRQLKITGPSCFI